MLKLNHLRIISIKQHIILVMKKTFFSPILQILLGIIERISNIHYDRLYII